MLGKDWRDGEHQRWLAVHPDSAARLAVEGVVTKPAEAVTAANDNAASLPRHGFIYLASPYSLYKHGLHMAARHASRAAASLMKKGLVVYSPIAHGHAIASVSDLPATWEFWKSQCQPMIDAASACVVLKLDGWRDSVGVRYEIDEFERQGKPIVYVDPEAAEERRRAA